MNDHQHETLFGANSKDNSPVKVAIPYLLIFCIIFSLLDKFATIHLDAIKGMGPSGEADT